ncbi:MAG: hypothetical protein J6R22_02110 [Alphaproteobacteria bacterium]|nr:hypothetical protein [Alphaproteobacteria bacterium]
MSNYTKSDFMTAAQIAKKFNIATDEVVKLMRLHIGRNVPNDPIHPILIRSKTSHNQTSSILLHPAGREEFEKIIKEHIAKKATK